MCTRFEPVNFVAETQCSTNWTNTPNEPYLVQTI